MKINFSNLAKLFLAGVCFVAVGCTDYGQDIENLNNRITALETDTIDPLKADLEKTKETLAEAQKAIADHATQHAEDVAALQQADENLQKAINDAAKKAADDLKALADELKAADAKLASDLAKAAEDLQNGIDAVNKKVDAEVARIDAAVQANALSIEALQTALAETDARLQNAIKEGDDKLAADLLETEAKLTQMIQDHVATVEAEIAKIYTEISALKTVDANLQEQINTLVSELATTNANVAANAEAIANNVKAIAQNATDIAANKEAIAANAEAIAKLNEALNAHVAEFLTFKAATEASIADLYVKIEELKAKDVELQGLIEALDVRLTANEALAAQNAADIKANKELFDEFVVATNETLELLKAADVQLQSNIDALDAALKAYQQAIRAELDAHYGEFAAHQAKTEAEFKKVNDAIAANAAAINANAAAIADNKAAIANNATAIAALDARLTDLEKAHADLKAAHESLVADFTAYKAEIAKALASIEAAQLEQDAKIKLNSEQIAALQESVKKLDEKVEKYYTELNNKISELEKSLKAMIEDVAADVAILKGRIQSIVYVPVYTDGMATIEYAMFGNKIIECNSVLTYQVHPANCAAAVKKEDLSFLFQGLKTRATAAPELEVVGVKVADATKGTIDVTVQAHNLGDNFYFGKDVSADYSKYAVSLVFAHNDATTGIDNNIASCYTTLISENRDDVSIISMGILNKEKKEIHASEAQPVEKYEIIYSNLEAKAEFMHGCYPVFKIGNGKWFTYDQIVSAGYQISVPVQTIAYNYFDKAGVAPDDFKSVYNNVESGEGYAQYVTSNLAKVEKLAVKSYETVTYTYATDGNNVSTTGKLTIIKDQGTFNLGEATINWARNLDNLKANFAREDVEYTLAEKVLAGKNTSYSEAVAGTLTVLKVNNEDILANTWDLTDDKMSAELVKVAKDAEPVLKFEGFEWNKTYTFVAVYELDNIDVTINFSVKTVLPLYTINLKPMTITWNYAQDWESTLGLNNIHTERTLDVVVDAVEGVPTYANVIKNGVQNSITDPQPTYELAEKTIKCTQFEWNKAYEFTTEYALDDALVTINGEISTIQTLKNIEVVLPLSTYTMKKDMVISDLNDVLAPAFTKENIADLCLGTTTIEDYLSDIFANASLPAATISSSTRATIIRDENGNDKVVETLAANDTTKLSVVADGQSINTYYSYVDATVIPDKVVYNLVVATWYGIEISFVKTVEFNMPKYDYQHIDYWVDFDTNYYFSTAILRYAFADGTDPASSILKGVISRSELNTAFDVVSLDENGAVVSTVDMLTENGKNTKLGLVSEFALKNTPRYPGITLNDGVLDNVLYYLGRDAYVGVTASLYLENSTVNGVVVRRKLDTSFDAKGKYSNYRVNKSNPISPLMVDYETTPGGALDIYVTKQAKVYKYYISNHLQVRDGRLNSFNDNKGYKLIAHGVRMQDETRDEWTQAGAKGWIEGDGTSENGFATGYGPSSIYGLKFKKLELKNVPDVLASAVKFTPATGEIVFTNLNQIKLVRPVTLDVVAEIEHTWAADAQVKQEVENCKASFTITIWPLTEEGSN